MYQHILIPTDGSELSGRGVDAALRLAAQLGARTTALTVSEPFHKLSFAPSQVEYSLVDYRQHAEAAAQRTLGQVQAKAETLGVGCDTVWLEHEHPFRAIIDLALSRQCDLIAMASHGRHGISAIVLGSQTVKVLTHSTIPVLVYR